MANKILDTIVGAVKQTAEKQKTNNNTTRATSSRASSVASNTTNIKPTTTNRRSAVQTSVPETTNTIRRRNTKSVSEQDDFNIQNTNGTKTRNDFSSDRDYETYILDNRVDTTKGDAFNYLQQKAKEQNVIPRMYLEGMRTRYKDRKDTEKTYEKYQKGELDDKSVEELNNRFSAIIDNEGNEVDSEKYNNDIDLVNKTSQDINSKIEKLNKDYTDGKIDYETMQNEYNRYVNMFNENASYGEQLNSYKTVQGFDYYDWAKQTGKDVSDFEAYVENYNDWLPERLAQSWTASWYDTLNTIPNAVDDVISFFNPDYEGSKLSGNMSETAQILRDYAHAGAKVWQEYPLKAAEGVMPYVNDLLTANFLSGLAPNAVASLAHTSLLGQEVGGVESLANYMMQMQTASQTYRQRISEGNGQVTSALNGIIHGILSGQIEELNAGELPALLFGSGTAKYMIGTALIQKASPKMIFGMLHEAGKSEGREEVIETFLDNVADNVQNFLWGNLSGDKVAVTELNPADMASEYLLAYAGSYILGIPGSVNFTIDSRQRYNTAQEIVKHCDSTIASPLAMAEEKQLAQACKESLGFAMRTYEENSMTEGKIELASDAVPPMATYGEMMNNLINAMQPDAVSQYQHAQETLAQAKKTQELLQTSLYERGINMRADQFVDLDSTIRQNIIQKNQVIQEACPNANIGYATSYIVDGKDLMADSNAMIITEQDGKPTIIVNPNGDTALIVSALHEILHTTEGTKEYNDIYNTVFSEKGSDLKKINELLGDRYKGFKLSTVGKEALVITITEDMMSEADAEKFIKHMAKYNTSLAYKMMYKFQDVLGLTKNDSQLERVTRLLTDALSKQNKVFMPDGVAFSKDKNYDSRHQLEDFAKDPANALRDGKTYFSPLSRIGRYKWMPKNLRSSAIVFQREALEQFLTGNHFVLKHKAHDSTSGIDVVKNLDYLIDNPLAVYKTPDGSGSYTLILDIKDEQGNPVIVGFNPVEHSPGSVSYYDVDMNPHTEFAGMIKGIYGKTKWATYTDENGEKHLTPEGEEAFNHFFDNYGDPIFPEGMKKDDVIKSVGGLLLSVLPDTSSNPSINEYLQKSRQLDIIENSRSKSDGKHKSIEKIDDIKTFKEAIEDPDDIITEDDYTEEDIKEALKNGYITVYSSHPVVGGSFVTASRIDAEDRWQGKELYDKTVRLDNVAWQDNEFGQYAPIEPEIKFSKKQLDTHLTNEVESYYDTIAPYLDTNLTKDNRQELVDMASKSYTNATNAIAQALGVDYVGRVENIGGYLNDEGKKLRELSWTHTLNTEPVKAKLFASLMGDLAFENQEAVISYRYLNDVNPSEIKVGAEGEDGGTNGVESIIKFNDVGKILDSLEKADIANYSIDRENNILRIQDFGFESDLSDKISQLVDDAIEGGNIDEEIEARAIYSYYLDRVSRQNLYLERLEGQNGQRGRGSSSLSGQARELVQKAYDRVTDVIENGPESPFLRRNAEVRYSKFDPAKNKDMRDNLGNKISPNMAKRIEGTRLTGEGGRPFNLYHTSDNLFSEFDPRGTDYYRYGDKIVNFYSTDPILSDSYSANGSMQIRSLEDYKKHGNAKAEVDRIQKQIDNVFEEQREQVYEKQKEIVDIFSRDEVRSLLSDAFYKLRSARGELNAYDRGIVDIYIDELEDSLSQNVTLGKERQMFARYRNLSDWVYDDWYNSSMPKVLLEVIDDIKGSDAFSKMKAIDDSIQELRDNTKAIIDPLVEEQNQYYAFAESGKQYVGYGKALNPYILKNDTVANWNRLNDGDFRVDFEKYLGLQTECWNIFEQVPDYESLKEIVKSKNRTNRFILSNVDEDIKEYLVENPIVLANVTNMVKEAFYSDYDEFDVALGLDDDVEEKSTVDKFRDVLDGMFAKVYEYDAGYGHDIENEQLFKVGVSTNDVVSAVLAINDYTDNPYDGVVFENITDSASYDAEDIVSDVVALFESNQFKSVGNENPTDNPDIFFSRKKNRNTQSVSDEDEGVSNRYFNYGENPARNVDILRETEAGPTRRHANNMANSEWVTDEEAQRIQEAVENGDYAYAPVHFQEVDQQAMDRLRQIGKAKAMKEVTSNPDEVTLEKASLARQLLNQMRIDGEEGTPEYERLQRINTSFYTPSAQILAYARWLRNSTPEGQIITIESEIARMQSELEQRWGDKAPDLVIPEDLRREYIETKDEGRRQEIREEIAQMIADKIPPTLLEQLNAYRHLAMLFNPRTWIKNSLSNRIFGGIDELTRAVRSGLETVAKNYGDTHEKSIFHGMELQAGTYNRFNEQERKLKKHFEQDYMDNFRQNISKYSNMDIGAFLSTSEFGEMVRDKRKSFSWDFMNKLEEINAGEGKGWLKYLGLSDVPAMKNAYSKAMVGYFKKNNLTLDNVTEEQMKKARDFAFNEALYATFNTNNWLATQITKFEQEADKKGIEYGAAARFAVESFIPFKRTPLNIIRTGYNYTTVGLATNLAHDLYLIKKGKMTPNQMINHLAQGLTGSGLIALGWLLSHMGIFRTKDDDKDRKQYFDEDNGEQDYSLNFDGGSYTIDWLDPMIVPMAVGAEINKAVEEGGLNIQNAVNIISSVADPIFETSMFSGISKNLQSYQKGTKEWYGEIAKNIAKNYMSQYVPASFGALARTVDDTRRNTYTSSENKNPFNTKFAKQIKNKIPGLSMTNEPYINKQGQVEKNEDLGMGMAGRAFLNFISPGYYSSKDIDEYDEELYRLYEETGEIDAFPSQASNNVKYDKETMKFTDKEYTAWQQTRWQTEAKYVNEFIDSDAYKNMSDEERVATIKDIRDYAQKVAKKEFLEGRGKKYEDDKQLNNATSALESGVSLYNYYDYLNNAGTKQAEKIQYLEGMDLTDEQREQLYNLSGYKTSYQDAYNKSMKEKNKEKNSKSSSKKKSSGGSKKTSSGKSKSTSSSKKGGGSKPSSTLKTGKSFKLANPTNLKFDTQKVNTSKYLSSYYNTMRGSKNVSSGSSGTVVCPKCGNRVSSASGKCPICGTRL